MKRRRALRLPAALLALTLILPTAAQALTPEEARELLAGQYIDPVSEEVLSQPTVEDMLTALGDPYTVYYTPEDYAAFLASMEDSVIVGIGISSQVTADGVVVETVFEGTPAYDGGLQAGDLIIKVDGVELAGLDQETITAMLRGEEDTQVQVTYRRDHNRRTVQLTRREIVIPATTTRMLGDHIGYIDCTTFGSETLDHFVEGIETYEREAERWILDLTGNGGGAAMAAARSAACFTGPGHMAYLQDGTGQIAVYAPDNKALTLSPVIVLTDSATASASELFAAAVRDRNAGLVVGWRTFGKGTAQTLLDQSTHPAFFPDGDALKVTAYRFYSASGGVTDTVGVIPHLLVDPNLAEDVAVLLSNPNPPGDTEGLLRIDFGWRWYVDLDLALSEEYAPAFSALLEALPASIKVWEGTGGPDGWRPTSAAEVAEAFEVDYTPRSFTDTADSPYAGQIDALATYYMIPEYAGESYNPTAILTRAGLCSLLAQALGCRVPEGENAFADVPADAWYAPAVNAIADMGLVAGAGDGLFRPKDLVTHEELITITGRLASILDINLAHHQSTRPEDALESEVLAPYAPWAREQVWLLAQSQTDLFGNTICLLWDDPAAIDPAAAATREEAACLLYNLLSYTGILPV